MECSGKSIADQCCLRVLTKCLDRMGEVESIHCQEQKEEDVSDEVDKEEGSSVIPPFVLQKACHHWVPQQFCTRIPHLQEHKRNIISIDILQPCCSRQTYGEDIERNL